MRMHTRRHLLLQDDACSRIKQNKEKNEKCNTIEYYDVYLHC